MVKQSFAQMRSQAKLGNEELPWRRDVVIACCLVVVSGETHNATLWGGFSRDVELLVCGANLMVNSEDRTSTRSNWRGRKWVAGFLSQIRAPYVICLLLVISLPSQVSAQHTISRGDALRADLAEAIQMLEKSQFELLTYDFMPAEMIRDMRSSVSRQYGRPDSRRTSFSAFPEPMKNQLIGELKAAQSGEITWNRDKSLVWIQFTTKPIEVVPAQKSGYVPRSTAAAQAIDGLGEDVDEVLSQAVRLLESKRFAEFAGGMLPIDQAAELQSPEAVDRWVHRLKQNPTMVDAMIRDLKAAQSGTQRQTSDRVSVESKAAGVILQLEKVSGSWRLASMDASLQDAYQQMAHSEIAASIIPAQRGTVVLTFTENRWRLMAMPTRLPSPQDVPSRR